MRVSFGMGDATSFEVLRIAWPSGIVQDLPGLALKTIHTIIEPLRLKPGGAGKMRVAGWTEVDHVIEVSEDFKSCRPLGTVMGGLKFSHPDGAIGAQRFYRARLQP